jgi:ABC-type glycerol-3-phosphate transport system permease component
LVIISENYSKNYSSKSQTVSILKQCAAYYISLPKIKIMDTTITIIGIVIAIIVALPIYYFARSSAASKSKILEIKKKFNPANPNEFDVTESQNKKTLTIDTKNRKFILMNFNENQQESTFVDLKTVSSCKLILTSGERSDSIEKIDFEFQERETSKKVTIPFYDFDDDRIKQISAYQDHQFAKKWLKIIQDCI